MSEIINFPSIPDHKRKRFELADYLRKMAEYVESEAIESPPVAIMMVLTSDSQHEILHKGYEGQKAVLREAARVANKFTTTGYSRRGGNKYDRNS